MVYTANKTIGQISCKHMSSTRVECSLACIAPEELAVSSVIPVQALVSTLRIQELLPSKNCCASKVKAAGPESLDLQAVLEATGQMHHCRCTLYAAVLFFSQVVKLENVP